MKKMMILLIAVTVLFAGNAFAANVEITSDSTTVLGGIEYQPSTSVQLMATATTVAYGAAAVHAQGTKIFSGSDASSEITETEVDKGTTLTAVAIDGTPTYSNE